MNKKYYFGKALKPWPIFIDHFINLSILSSLTSPSMAFMMNSLNHLSTLKPALHIQILLDAFMKAEGVRKAISGKRFKLLKHKSSLCFLLYSGSCVISRYSDSLVISTVSSPSILGVNTLIEVEADVVIEAKTDIEYMQIPVDEFLAFIDKHDLWKHVSYLLMFHSSRLNEYQRKHAGIPTYKLISNLLYALNNEDFETRAMTSAAEYIQERTFLSRSGIMKILSELKAGGYIVIKRGLLIKINKLPEKF